MAFLPILVGLGTGIATTVATGFDPAAGVAAGIAVGALVANAGANIAQGAIDAKAADAKKAAEQQQKDALAQPGLIAQINTSSKGVHLTEDDGGEKQLAKKPGDLAPSNAGTVATSASALQQRG